MATDRQIRRLTEERTVVINEVNTTTGQIVMHDQYGTTLYASLDFSNPVISIPVAGESWIAQRRNTSWYLTKKQSGASDITNLASGDTRVSSSNTLHLDAPTTNINNAATVGGSLTVAGALNINGSLNIPDGSITLGKLAVTGIASSSTYLRGDGQWAAITIPPSIPTGALMMYGDAAAPSGWVLADGSAILRTGANATLFTLYGTKYGIGDGSTTFNVPDLRGRVPVGYAASGGHADVSTLGANDGQAIANRRPKHRTSNALTLPTHVHDTGAGGYAFQVLGVPTGGTLTAGASGGGTYQSPSLFGTTGNPTSTPSMGGSIGTNNANDALDAPSYIVINYIIKL